MRCDLRGNLTRAWLAAGAVLTAAVLAGCGSDAAQDLTVISVPAPGQTVTVAGTGTTADAPASDDPPDAGPDAAPAGDDDADAAAPNEGVAIEPGVSASEVEATPPAEPPAPNTTLSLATPAGASPVIWVRARHEVELRTEPGGGELVARVGRKTEFGSPSVFGVVEQRGDWAGVTTSMLPNGRVGWIKLDPKRVEAGWTRYSLVVDLSERRAALLRGKRTALSFPVTIGAPGSETPLGRYAVTDTFTGLNSAAYGCCALALSATQPHLPSGWLGGRRIAIHGTSGPLGIAASHGCVRAADADVAKLADRVPLGTPVFIRA